MLVAFICSACHIKPFNVLSEKEMTDVLVDLHLTTAAINIRVPIEQKAIRQQYINAVFEKHGLTREEFETSLDWYTKNSKQLSAIYDAVELQLTQMETDVDNYVYHPELNPANDTIDTINIWMRPTRFHYALKATDSLRFEWHDSNFLTKGDKLIWSYVLKLSKSDTLPAPTMEFGVKYTDGTIDSIRHRMHGDTLKRQITVTHTMRSQPIKLWGIFCASEQTDDKNVTIDTVWMTRIFNKKSHPLDTAWRTHLDTLQKRTYNLPLPQKVMETKLGKANELMALPDKMPR